MTILKDMTQEDMLARIAELEAKLERAKHRKLSMKVSEKGALSVYGLGRFPITLYRGQWDKLLAAKDEIVMFMLDNASGLSEKD